MPKGKCKKFTLTWSGPFIITGIFNEVDYQLKPASGKGRRKMGHRNNLKRYIDLGLEVLDMSVQKEKDENREGVPIC